MALTYEELLTFAMEHYWEGGDSIVEAWEETEFNEWVEEFGPLTKEKALKLFKFCKNF